MQTQPTVGGQREDATPPRIYSGLGTRGGRGRDLVVRASLLDMPGRERMREKAQGLGISIGVMGGAAAKHASGGGGTPLTIFTSNPPVAYFDSRLGITGSAPVTQIADQTANGHNLTVFGSGPSLNATDATISNLQTVSFGAGKSMYISGGLSLTPPFSYLYVGKLNTWLSTGRLIGDAAGANRGELACAGSSPAVYMNNGSYVNTVSPTLATWYLFVQKFTNSTADSLQLASGAASTGSNAGNGTVTQPGLNLGGSTLATDFLMLLIFTGATPWLSGELSSLRTYLTGLSASINV